MNLIPPHAEAELRVLARRLRHGPGSTAWARAVARVAGASSEFLDRRPYVLGDDRRSIDWKGYAKTLRPVVKRFHSERAPELHILLDGSGSLALGEPSKLECARGLSAMLAYLGTSVGARVQLWLGTEAGVRRLGQASSRVELLPLFTALMATRAEGKTALSEWILHVAERASSEACLIVASDLLDTGALWPSTFSAAKGRLSLAFFQILEPRELEPSFEGDLTLQAVETNEQLDVDVDARTLAAYRAEIQKWFNELDARSKQLGHAYQRFVAGADPLPGLRQFVAHTAAAHG
ncbi:MAG TPA: DUF58 domain-containing protein [Polyangiaceae bacterium]|nr:DUF58 domain-containing protein [Polyangiaceae bacterium]